MIFITSFDKIYNINIFEVFMARIYTGLGELIGKTPLVELKGIEKELGLCARLLCKLESYNPAGSAKDRVALAMIKDGLETGRLTEKSVIIEPTSGNTGIGLAAVGAALGIKVVIVMPDSMSVERQRLMRAYGAEFVLTEGALGMTGAIKKAEELTRETAGGIMLGQFTNPKNPEAHYKTTGPEILEDTDGEIDFFVAGVGTGGTVSGVGRFLKEKNSDIKVIGVEPSDSPVLSGGTAGAHKLQGIGAGFIPETLDRNVIDEIITVSTDEAYVAGRLIAVREGLLVGISSGAALHAAIDVARRKENEGKTVVALLPDTGERYLSSEMFCEA